MVHIMTVTQHCNAAAKQQSPKLHQLVLQRLKAPLHLSQLSQCEAGVRQQLRRACLARLISHVLCGLRGSVQCG